MGKAAVKAQEGAPLLEVRNVEAVPVKVNQTGEVLRIFKEGEEQLAFAVLCVGKPLNHPPFILPVKTHPIQIEVLNVLRTVPLSRCRKREADPARQCGRVGKIPAAPDVFLW